ncbi:hypothetical protein JCM10212_004486 [Sporobolomyces blumeae]
MESPTLSNGSTRPFSWSSGSSVGSTPSPIYESGELLTPFTSASDRASYFDPFNCRDDDLFAEALAHDGYSTKSSRPSSISSSLESPCSYTGSTGPLPSPTTHALHMSTAAFVEGLKKIQHVKNVETNEWKWKCHGLEAEVDGLKDLVRRLTYERDELRLEMVAVRSANLVFGSGSSDVSNSPQINSTPCQWDGAHWVPIVVNNADRPQIDPSKSMSKQNPPPCNSFYLLGACEVPRCRFCHLYDLTSAQISEMRRGAKFHLCNAIQNGVACPDGADCIYGHFCPRGPSCSRQHCAFNDEQHRVVPSPRPVLRRRTSRPAF